MNLQLDSMSNIRTMATCTGPYSVILQTRVKGASSPKDIKIIICLSVTLNYHEHEAYNRHLEAITGGGRYKSMG